MPTRNCRKGQYETSVPAVRDRIVQAACKIVLEPIFEADMCQCSFGFRPRRSAHDALQVLVDEAEAIRGDLSRFLDELRDRERGDGFARA